MTRCVKGSLSSSDSSRSSVPEVALPPHSVATPPDWTYTVSNGRHIGFNGNTKEIEFTDPSTGLKTIYKDGVFYKDDGNGNMMPIKDDDEYRRLLSLLQQLLGNADDKSVVNNITNYYSSLGNDASSSNAPDGSASSNDGRDGAAGADGRGGRDGEDSLSTRVIANIPVGGGNGAGASSSNGGGTITLPNGDTLTRKDVLSSPLSSPTATGTDRERAIVDASNEYKTQNGQVDKNEFLKEARSGKITSEWITTNHIANGTIIPITIINGVNSDLPGEIIGEVAQNVYDTLTGSKLLLPKGTRLIASYDSAVTFGQTRLLVVWNYLVRPDGFTMSLPGFSATNRLGYAGLDGSVDMHLGGIVGGSVLSSLLSVGAGVATSLVNENIYKSAASSITSSMTTTADKYLDKQINRQPTIIVPPATSATLLVSQTIRLDDYKGAAL